MNGSSTIANTKHQNQHKQQQQAYYIIEVLLFEKICSKFQNLMAYYFNIKRSQLTRHTKANKEPVAQQASIH